MQPVAKEASRELLQQLLQQLPLQYPQRFRVDGPVIHNLVNGTCSREHLCSASQLSWEALMDC